MGVVARDVEVEPVAPGQARLPALRIGHRHHEQASPAQERARPAQGLERFLQVLERMPEHHGGEMLLGERQGQEISGAHLQLQAVARVPSRLVGYLDSQRFVPRPAQGGEEYAASAAHVQDGTGLAEPGDEPSPAQTEEPHQGLDAPMEAHVVPSVVRGGVVGPDIRGGEGRRGEAQSAGRAAAHLKTRVVGRKALGEESPRGLRPAAQRAAFLLRALKGHPMPRTLE